MHDTGQAGGAGGIGRCTGFTAGAVAGLATHSRRRQAQRPLNHAVARSPRFHSRANHAARIRSRSARESAGDGTTQACEERRMSRTTRANDPDIPEPFIEYLRNKARRRDLVTYGEVAPLLGVDTGNEYSGTHVGRVLDVLNRREFDQSRPLISAIVVSADTGQPGSGYYGCARELRRYRGDDFEEWAIEVGRVHDYWSRH